MRASGESGGNDLLQCSQVGRSSSMTGLLHHGIVAHLFYVFESRGSMAREGVEVRARAGKWFLTPISVHCVNGGEQKSGRESLLERVLRWHASLLSSEGNGVRNHRLKYELWAEVHGGGDRCVPRQPIECLTCSVACTRVVNNGS